MKKKIETSYAGIEKRGLGFGIPISILAIILAIFALRLMTVSAQDPIPPIPVVYPPAGHSLNCLNDAEAAYYIGPQCATPVLWDLQGLHKIGGLAFFVDDGETVAGLLVGFVWNWESQEYDYLLLTEEHNAFVGYAGQYRVIEADRITYP